MGIYVLSLGGSLIVPDKVKLKYLLSFKKFLQQSKHRFVVVCGGGGIARTYISALRESGKSNYIQSLAGIAVTRMNARFMTYLFDGEADEGIPLDMKHVASLLKKRRIVFCGALRYAEKQTSDSTAAKLAHYFHAPFINITDVRGLYDQDPKKHKEARLIPGISWKDFLRKADALHYQAGQHFVLDQEAALVIKKHRIPTFIAGPDLKNLKHLLKGEHFMGTVVSG